MIVLRAKKEAAMTFTMTASVLLLKRLIGLLLLWTAADLARARQRIHPGDGMGLRLLQLPVEEFLEVLLTPGDEKICPRDGPVGWPRNLWDSDECLANQIKNSCGAQVEDK